MRIGVLAAIVVLTVTGCRVDAGPSERTSPAFEIGPQRFGVVTQGPGYTLVVRDVDDDNPVAVLDAAERGIVSPDGRRLAYWQRDPRQPNDRTLAVFDAVSGDVRTWLQLGGEEQPISLAWADDGTAIAFATYGFGAGVAGIDPAPLYSAVRVVDLASGKTREVARLPGRHFTVIGWDRARRLIVGSTGERIRGAIPATVSEDGTVTISQGQPSSEAHRLRYSTRAGTVVATFGNSPRDPAPEGKVLDDSGLIVWPIDSLDQPIVRRFGAGVFAIASAFVPGTADLLLTLQSDDGFVIERWTEGTGGDRSAVYRATYEDGYPSFFVRPDGRSIYVSSGGSVSATTVQPIAYTEIDLETGARRPVVGEPYAAMPIGDEARARRPGPLFATLDRDRAIATVRGLQRHVVAPASIEAKLTTWLDVLRVTSRLDPMARPLEYPIWSIHVIGELLRYDGDQPVPMSYGTWHLDGNTGEIVEFSIHPWRNLIDRAADQRGSGSTPPPASR